MFKTPTKGSIPDSPDFIITHDVKSFNPANKNTNSKLLILVTILPFPEIHTFKNFLYICVVVYLCSVNRIGGNLWQIRQI